VRNEADAAAVRQRTRELARTYGFRWSDIEALATAVSEIAHNVIAHGGGGDLVLSGTRDDAGRVGIVAIARDEGPGIADLEQAMTDGFSTGKGLGLGLPSARRLVDEFELESVLGQGTTVKLTKWRSPTS
jgi:serine/threonine-protein kinase RsbT